MFQGFIALSRLFGPYSRERARRVQLGLNHLGRSFAQNRGLRMTVFGLGRVLAVRGH